MEPSRHEVLTEFAASRGMSFSQFVRRACEEERHRLENDGVPRDHQPLLSELEQVKERLKELNALNEKIDEVQSRLDFLGGQSQSWQEMIADRIEHHLRNHGDRSIPELADELGLDRPTVQKGRALLEQQFRIQRIEPENPDTGKTVFTVRKESEEQRPENNDRIESQ